MVVDIIVLDIDKNYTCLVLFKLLIGIKHIAIHIYRV